MMNANHKSIIRGILYYGVISSAVLMIAGSVLLFSFGGAIQTSLNQMVSTSSINCNLLGAFQINGNTVQISDFLVGVGILILIAIPISRVVVTAFQFASERDRKYVTITLIVIFIVAVSFLVIGPVEAGMKL